MTQETVEKADKSWKKNKDPKVWRKAISKYEKNPANKKKISAKYKIRYLVKTGQIKKPKNCPKCGRGGVRIIGHHANGYEGENAKKVNFMCDKCHSKTPERTGAVLSRAVKRSLAAKKKAGK